MAKTYTGRCACGAVAFAFAAAAAFVANGYGELPFRCEGGAMATLLAVPVEDFLLTRGYPKTFRYTGNSGRLDRNFCPTCGARLFISNIDALPGTVVVALGGLDRSDAPLPPPRPPTLQDVDNGEPRANTIKRVRTQDLARSGAGPQNLDPRFLKKTSRAKVARYASSETRQVFRSAIEHGPVRPRTRRDPRRRFTDGGARRGRCYSGRPTAAGTRTRSRF